MKKYILILFYVVLGFSAGDACTSAIISGRLSRSVMPMIWKHRDTSHRWNYVDSVKGSNCDFDYIAVFNSSDSLKREAWAGVNRCGFAIINTVAGNLPENKEQWKDREGIIMTLALSGCRTVDDFERLLDSLPKPLGVRTNFGVIDRSGEGAYFETDDYGYVKFETRDNPSGFLVRSNFSFSGNKEGGYGFERYETASRVIRRHLSEKICPELFTEYLSRKYHDLSSDTCIFTEETTEISDRNFIPRPSSSSSVVIELTPDGPVMWTMLGYPPLAETTPVTIDNIPADVKRNPVTGMSVASEKANLLKAKIIHDGLIRFPEAKYLIEEKEQVSRGNYKLFRKNKIGLK